MSKFAGKVKATSVYISTFTVQRSQNDLRRKDNMSSSYIDADKLFGGEGMKTYVFTTIH